MTVEAQERMIFGALCMDETFRTEMFTPPQPGGVEETYYAKVERLLNWYGEVNGVAVDKSLVDHVLNVVRESSPCRVAAYAAFAAAKAAGCPCWPC